MTLELVEVVTDDFSAIVPSTDSLGYRAMLVVYRNPEPAVQVAILVDLLRDNLPPEKRREFDNLGAMATISVVNAWLDASLPNKTEGTTVLTPDPYKRWKRAALALLAVNIILVLVAIGLGII